MDNGNKYKAPLPSEYEVLKVTGVHPDTMQDFRTISDRTGIQMAPTVKVLMREYVSKNKHLLPTDRQWRY